MAMPMKHHPKPARNPAVAPQEAVVVGASRNFARLNAITRLSIKLRPKTLPILVGGAVSAKPLAARQGLSSTAYQPPPRTNAEIPATSTAHIGIVCSI